MKKLICRIFHGKHTVRQNFALVNVVTNESVYHWECEKCGNKFMSTSKTAMFRCYTDILHEEFKAVWDGVVVPPRPSEEPKSE